jgi:hypothetical protein
MKKSELKDFFRRKSNSIQYVRLYESDPVQIPHLFTRKEDIEIAGFQRNNRMGNRTMIIKNSHRMIDLMGNAL